MQNIINLPNFSKYLGKAYTLTNPNQINEFDLTRLGYFGNNYNVNSEAEQKKQLSERFEEVPAHALESLMRINHTWQIDQQTNQDSRKLLKRLMKSTHQKYMDYGLVDKSQITGDGQWYNYNGQPVPKYAVPGKYSAANQAQIDRIQSLKETQASIKLNQSISDDSPNQAFLDVHKHCNQESLTLSQVLKNSINMNNESLKYALAKNKIFLEAHTRNVTDIVITSDNKYIVSVSEDRTLRIWDLLSKRQECILRGHTYSIYCIAITSDDKYAISGSCDKTIRVWNLQDKIQESVLHGHTEQVDFVKLTNDDLYLISGSHNTNFRIWNLQNRTQEAVIISKVRIFPGNFVLTNDSIFCGTNLSQ